MPNADDLKHFQALPARAPKPLEGTLEAAPRTPTKAEDRVHAAKVKVCTLGAETAFGVFQTALEVWRIREEADANERNIRSQRERLEATLALQIKKLETQADLHARKGDTTLRILELMLPLMDQIPAMDHASRQAFLKSLPDIIKATHTP